MKTSKIILIGLAIIFFFIAVWGISLVVRYYTAKPEGIVGMQETVQSADFRMYSYEYFYNAKAHIIGLEAKYNAQRKKLNNQEKGTEGYSRTVTNIASLEGLIIDSKAKYNADAKKEKTTGQFRANDLPYQYDLSLPK